jgi:hypothetical protein
MEGGDWRLAGLQAGSAFVVDQGDCDHVGNRDVAHLTTPGAGVARPAGALAPYCPRERDAVVL